MFQNVRQVNVDDGDVFQNERQVDVNDDDVFQSVRQANVVAMTCFRMCVRSVSMTMTCCRLSTRLDRLQRFLLQIFRKPREARFSDGNINPHTAYYVLVLPG